MIFTRKDYMSDKCTHKEYYSQFVTQDIKDHVIRALHQSIAASKDSNFNDIPLDTWDRIGAFSVQSAEFKKLGDFRTAAGVVCVLKEAARQIKAVK